MFTNMKLACESAGFMPRSANHFIVKSRTSLLRARSLVMKLASCSTAAVAARMSASTFSELVPEPESHAFILRIVSACADGVADAQTGHAVRLRERPRDDDARVFDGERDMGLVIGGGDVVEVGLVHEDRRFRRDAVDAREEVA